MAPNNLLKNVYLFKTLPANLLAIVNEIATLETYNISDEIFSQGDEARALYVIKYGSVKIHKKTPSGDEVVVATLGSGSHFGEMAFVDQEKRSATATALEKSEIVSLSYKKLSEILDKHPEMAVHFYRELSHFLCGRLRLTTNDLSFAREKNVSHF